MNSWMSRASLASLFLFGSVVLGKAQTPPPSQEEMWRIIQEQARQIEVQGRELEALRRAQRGAAEAVPPASAPQVPVFAAATEAAPEVDGVLAPPSPVAGWWDRTSLGLYGELHYEGGNRDVLDFHRFVLFFGHEFSDSIRLFSELELEHAWAGEGRPGEVELEQAYVQLDVTDEHRLNAGIMLVPVGISNEVHEPPTFFGVERNPIETNIIPTTWWEAGIGLSGNFGASGIAYTLMASSGLNAARTGANAFLPRGGRQRAANAAAHAPALTAQFRYTGTPGLELAASGHYEFDITQNAGDPVTGDDVSAFLFSTHAAARTGGWRLRALFASWWIDSFAARASGRDYQNGYFIEPSYRFAVSGLRGAPGELGLFYRYNWWDNSAGIAADTATTQHMIGANYWPHPGLVFKLDYLWQEIETGVKSDRINAGLGFQF